MDVAICKVLLEEVVKSFCSAGDRGNVWERGSSAPGVRSMAWSHAFHGGSSSKASLEKTSPKSQYWTSTISLRGWLSSAFWASWANHCGGVSVAPMYCSSHSGGMNAASNSGFVNTSWNYRPTSVEFD